MFKYMKYYYYITFVIVFLYSLNQLLTFGFEDFEYILFSIFIIAALNIFFVSKRYSNGSINLIISILTKFFKYLVVLMSLFILLVVIQLKLFQINHPANYNEYDNLEFTKDKTVLYNNVNSMNNTYGVEQNGTLHLDELLFSKFKNENCKTLSVNSRLVKSIDTSFNQNRFYEEIDTTSFICIKSYPTQKEK